MINHPQIFQLAFSDDPKDFKIARQMVRQMFYEMENPTPSIKPDNTALTSGGLPNSDYFQTLYFMRGLPHNAYIKCIYNTVIVCRF
jgi:hypothetical protein